MISIYVDGSFINGTCGYGAVILKNGEAVERISGSLKDKKYTSARQVSGELYAVRASVEWCKTNNIKEADIFYDYKGIECWVTGAWKAKLPLTQEYSAFVRNCGVKIRWHKVAAHTGDRWNEEADRLAKGGTGIKPSAGKDIKAIKPEDVATQLDSFCLMLMDFIDARGYYSMYEGVFNSMYGRLEILDEENRKLGIIDIYKTAKKNFTADYRAFRDQQAERYLKSLVESVREDILGRI